MSLAYTSAEVLFGGFLWKEVISLEEEEMRNLFKCSQCWSLPMGNGIWSLGSPVPATRRRKAEIWSVRIVGQIPRAPWSPGHSHPLLPTVPASGLWEWPWLGRRRGREVPTQHFLPAQKWTCSLGGKATTAGTSTVSCCWDTRRLGNCTTQASEDMMRCTDSSKDHQAQLRRGTAEGRWFPGWAERSLVYIRINWGLVSVFSPPGDRGVMSPNLKLGGDWDCWEEEERLMFVSIPVLKTLVSSTSFSWNFLFGIPGPPVRRLSTLRLTPGRNCAQESGEWQITEV